MARQTCGTACGSCEAPAAFAAAAIGSLALGIGLNTDALQRRQRRAIPRQRRSTAPDRLVEIYTGLSKDFPQLTTSYPDYLDIRRSADALAERHGQRLCAGNSVDRRARRAGHGRSRDRQLLRCARHSAAARPRIPRWLRALRQGWRRLSFSATACGSSASAPRPTVIGETVTLSGAHIHGHRRRDRRDSPERCPASRRNSGSR